MDLILLEQKLCLLAYAAGRDEARDYLAKMLLYWKPKSRKIGRQDNEVLCFANELTAVGLVALGDPGV